jgi:hypothetical protein
MFTASSRGPRADIRAQVRQHAAKYPRHCHNWGSVRASRVPLHPLAAASVRPWTYVDHLCDCQRSGVASD